MLGRVAEHRHAVVTDELFHLDLSGAAGCLLGPSDGDLSPGTVQWTAICIHHSELGGEAGGEGGGVS